MFLHSWNQWFNNKYGITGHYFTNGFDGFKYYLVGNLTSVFHWNKNGHLLLTFQCKTWDPSFNFTTMMAKFTTVVAWNMVACTMFKTLTTRCYCFNKTLSHLNLCHKIHNGCMLFLYSISLKQMAAILTVSKMFTF